MPGLFPLDRGVLVDSSPIEGRLRQRDVVNMI